MQGVILVGGEGTRLRPLTYGTPKAMAPILGRPFLEHMLVYLRRHGVTDIHLALGHLPDPIVAYFGDGSRWGVRLSTTVEAQPLGSAGAIKQFEPLLGERFFAFNGDILTDFDLTAMLRQHEQAGAAVSIALMEVEDTAGFGVAAMDGSNRILRFVEKPPREEAPSHWANAGIWLFEPRVLAGIPAGQRSMVETALFPELIAAGERVQGYNQHGFWVDIGTPGRYLDVQIAMLQQPELCRLPLRRWPGASYLCSLDDPSQVTPPSVAADAAIRGPVLLGQGVRIESGARVQGPAVLGNGCVLEQGARLERSVLWDGCRLSRGASVSSSVLAHRVSVGAGCLLEGVTAGHDAVLQAGSRNSGGTIDPVTAPS